MLAILSAVCLAWLAPHRAFAQASPCNLNQDASTNVADVQLSVNMVLGLAPCTANIVAPGVCDIVVVQRVVNAALGGPCITNTVPSPHSVLLTWTPSVSGNVIGSNVYRGTTAGGPYTKINSSPVSGNSYTDTTVQNGVTYFYVVTAVSNTGAESGYSNMGTAPVPST
jgi:hypothetical protein